jgi:hypothetical protein
MWVMYTPRLGSQRAASGCGGRSPRFGLQVGFQVVQSDLVQNADGTDEWLVKEQRFLGPELDFTLPSEPLTLFEVIGKLPDLEDPEELRTTRNEIDEFLSDLSASVEKLDFGSR